jgi:hypothetical protein
MSSNLAKRSPLPVFVRSSKMPAGPRRRSRGAQYLRSDSPHIYAESRESVVKHPILSAMALSVASPPDAM